MAAIYQDPSVSECCTCNSCVTYSVCDEVLLRPDILELWIRGFAYAIRQSVAEKLIELVLFCNGVASLSTLVLMHSSQGHIHVPAIGKR
jgi:hypothetical protein